MGIVLALALIVFIYFIPALVASNRKHVNSLAISMLNLFLGWTLVGWVIALVWACTNNTAKAATAS
jgi:hypothetical protein